MIVGEFLADGTYFVWGNSSTTGAILDVSGATPTLVRVLSAPDASVVGADVAVNPIDGKLYTVRATGTHELTIDPVTGVVTAGPALTPPVATAGGQWFLPDGTLMAYANVAGGPQAIFAIDIPAGRVTRLGDAPRASNVDAASCAYGLALTKDVAPRTVVAGDELVYTYTATSRALWAGTLDFVDVLPPGMTYVDGGVTVEPLTFGVPSAYAGADTLRVSGTLLRGETVRITARVRVTPDHACDVDVANQAQGTLSVVGLPPVMVDSDDPTTVDPADATVARVTCSADLELAKVADRGVAHPDAPLAYRLTVRNLGASTARDVVVTDTLPSQLTVVAAPAGCTVAGQVVTCAVATLAPGAAHAFELSTRVAPAATGTIVNDAAVTSRTPDPNLPNNRVRVPTPVEELADLSIVKHAEPAAAVPGERLTYRLVVSNAGPSTARDVRVTDRLPAGLRLVSADRACRTVGRTVTCEAGALTAGATVTYRIVVRVASSVDAAIVNTAEVTSSTRDPDPSNNRSTKRVPLNPVADLAIEKVPSVDRVLVGQQLFYTLIVRNLGPSDATGVTVTDTAGGGLTLLSARASSGSCAIAGATVTCRIGRLASGGSAQVLVAARADQAGELANDAEVEGDQRDPRRPNNRVTTRVPALVPPAPPVPPATPSTPVLPEPADLTVVKSASRTAVLGRGAIRYTIRVVNRGPGTATGVRVVDTPSLPIRVGSVRTSQGRCGRAVPLRCELGTLAPGARAAITFVARPQAPGSLRNSASVTGEVPDPNPGDNLDGATTSVRGLLKVRKTADNKRVRAGAKLGYRITVTNASGFALRRVRVCDRLPAGLAPVGARPKGRVTGGQRCWTVARLGAGRSRTFRVTARVLRGASGRLVNRATASAPGARAARGRVARDRAPIQVIAGRIRSGGVTG